MHRALEVQWYYRNSIWSMISFLISILHKERYTKAPHVYLQPCWRVKTSVRRILGVMTFAGHEFSDPCPIFLSAITASPYLKFSGSSYSWLTFSKGNHLPNSLKYVVLPYLEWENTHSKHNLEKQFSIVLCEAYSGAYSILIFFSKDR